MVAVVERIKVIDSDTHVSEPEDLWTSRVSVQKWGDMVPHVKWDPERNEEAWYFGGERFAAAAGPAMAGWKEFPPSHPPRMADADPGSWNPIERLKRMDEYGLCIRSAARRCLRFVMAWDGRRVTFGSFPLIDAVICAFRRGARRRPRRRRARARLASCSRRRPDPSPVCDARRSHPPAGSRR